MRVFVASFSSPSRWCSLFKGSTSSSKSSSSSSGRRNERGATIQKRGGARTSASSLSSENHSRGKPNKSEPYKFMGRTVKEKHVFDSQMANELALEVVSEETGVEKEELKKTLQNLQSLLPELSSSSLSSNADAYRASLDIKLVARNAIQIKSVFRELRSNVSEMIAKDLRLALDPRASERCEKALEVLTGRGEMTREEAENLVFATHRYCADKKKMLAFCEEETVLEVCENVRRIRSAVGGEAFLAHKVCEKGDAAANMLFESEKNEAACNAAKALVERMPKDCNVALMVSDFPNLLLMDIDRLFFDLTNAFKSTPPEETLRRDPSVSFRFENNSAKSQALGPAANTMQAEEDNFGLMRELPNSRRDILAGAFAAFLFGGNLSLTTPQQFAYAYSEEYEKDTLDLLAKTKAFIAKQNYYEDVYESYAKWNTKYSVPGAVDTKRFGKSFLLTTKIFSLVKGGNIEGLEQKANEWVNVASALTDGTLSGKEARDTYGNLVWANNDKSDPKNRIGLCAFGETAGTKFFNINCDGF